MRALVCAAIALAFAGPLAAQPRFDRGLEKAAADIVAGKMGEIRGSFDFGVRPVMVMARDGLVSGRNKRKRSAPPPEGMERATERRILQAPL